MYVRLEGCVVTGRLVIRDAQLRGVPVTTDVAIADGRIVEIGTGVACRAAPVIEADGRLLVPAFNDPHCHAAKSFYGEWARLYSYTEPALDPLDGMDGGFGGAAPSAMADYDRQPNVAPIRHQWAFKRRASVDDVFERVCRVLDLALSNGVLAMRLFCDVDSHVRLKEVEASLMARERYGDVMRLQVCAFPQEGIAADPESVGLMVRAMESGADVVGGIPWTEWTDELAREHADFCFELAERFDAPLHFLCDDTRDPTSRTLEYVAARTIRSGMQGRVCSSHNGALRYYDPHHARRVMALVRNAGIAICSNSHVNFNGAFTLAHEFVDLGVTVAVGQDDVDNFYYPFGRCDPLEWAWSMAHAGRFCYREGIEQVFDMITSNSARAIGLDDYGIEVGKLANLVLLDARHPREAIQYRSDRLHVISRGRPVASTRTNRRLLLDLEGPSEWAPQHGQETR
jgi:cytosine deaminase